MPREIGNKSSCWQKMEHTHTSLTHAHTNSHTLTHTHSTKGLSPIARTPATLLYLVPEDLAEEGLNHTNIRL